MVKYLGRHNGVNDRTRVRFVKTCLNDQNPQRSGAVTEREIGRLASPSRRLRWARDQSTWHPLGRASATPISVAAEVVHKRVDSPSRVDRPHQRGRVVYDQRAGEVEQPIPRHGASRCGDDPGTRPVRSAAIVSQAVSVVPIGGRRRGRNGDRGLSCGERRRQRRAAQPYTGRLDRAHGRGRHPQQPPGDRRPAVAPPALPAPRPTRH